MLEYVIPVRSSILVSARNLASTIPSGFIEARVTAMKAI